MNALKKLLEFLRGKATPASEADGEWLDALQAFERGEANYAGGQYQAALGWFDKAIERGVDRRAYASRGGCLQALEFHLDAIEDFNRAIALEPTDCNLYYMRSLSRGAIGDFEGSISDLQEAIRLSQIATELNRTYRAGAVDMGWRNGHTAFYQAQLLKAQLDMEMPPELRERIRDRHSAKR